MNVLDKMIRVNGVIQRTSNLLTTGGIVKAKFKEGQFRLLAKLLSHKLSFGILKALLRSVKTVNLILFF